MKLLWREVQSIYKNRRLPKVPFSKSYWIAIVSHLKERLFASRSHRQCYTQNCLGGCASKSTMTFDSWEFVVIHCIAFAAPSHTWSLFCNRVMCVQLCVLASHKIFFLSQFVKPICVYHSLHSKSAFHGRFISPSSGSKITWEVLSTWGNYSSHELHNTVFASTCV